MRGPGVFVFLFSKYQGCVRRALGSYLKLVGQVLPKPEWVIAHSAHPLLFNSPYIEILISFIPRVVLHVVSSPIISRVCNVRARCDTATIFLQGVFH